MNKILKY